MASAPPAHRAFMVSSMSCWWMTRSLGVAPTGMRPGGASERVIWTPGPLTGLVDRAVKASSWGAAEAEVEEKPWTWASRAATSLSRAATWACRVRTRVARSEVPAGFLRSLREETEKSRPDAMVTARTPATWRALREGIVPLPWRCVLALPRSETTLEYRLIHHRRAVFFPRGPVERTRRGRIEEA